MVVANATGCSSIYGGSAPTCPYTVNKNGNGPAWGNSLFEDNAEFGYGMNLAYKARRARLATLMNKAIELGACSCVGDAFKLWLENMENADVTKEVKATVDANLDNAIAKAEGELKTTLTAIKDSADCIVKKSIWIFGGDGWAYDIGLSLIHI